MLSTSAAQAQASATAAATSATNAANSATAAASSQSNAAASATAAAASYDSFDDRYLGAKSSAPTVDNSGDALVAGALYFNTSIIFFMYILQVEHGKLQVVQLTVHHLEKTT